MSLLINYRLYLLVSFCGVKSSETGDVIGKHATPLLISLLFLVMVNLTVAAIQRCFTQLCASNFREDVRGGNT